MEPHCRHPRVGRARRKDRSAHVKGTMKIRRKLLITFTLAGGIVAIVGASGIQPLLRI